MSLSLAHEPDDALIVRAAWLYYVGGLTQDEAARRLGVHRTRVVRLLAEARDRGLVSITIQHEQARDLAIEDAIAGRYGLDFCLATPVVGFVDTGIDAANVPPLMAMAQGLIARHAVGSAAANFLKGKLAACEAMTVGVSWGAEPGTDGAAPRRPSPSARALRLAHGLAHPQLGLQPVRGRAGASCAHWWGRPLPAGTIHRRHAGRPRHLDGAAHGGRGARPGAQRRSLSDQRRRTERSLPAAMPGA